MKPADIFTLTHILNFSGFVLSLAFLAWLWIVATNAHRRLGYARADRKHNGYALPDSDYRIYDKKPRLAGAFLVIGLASLLLALIIALA